MLAWNPPPRLLTPYPLSPDTWNRDEMNLTGSKFVQGPVPRNSLSPPTGSPDSLYSGVFSCQRSMVWQLLIQFANPFAGLLECPLTTRIRKDIAASYSAKAAACDADAVISTSAECFEASTKLFDAAGGVR